jgi:hypothetical protein
VAYGRQADILDPAKAAATHVTVIGLGTIGSHAALELARMGIGSLSVIDADQVEAHNLPSQAYGLSDLGRPKAEALAEQLGSVSDHLTVRAEARMAFGGEAFDPGPVILAVDQMETRRELLELSLADRPAHPLLIDGRMAGKMWQLLAFDPSDRSTVDRWLAEHYFPQSAAHPLPCGGRSVSFIGAFTGALIASYVCRQIMGSEVPFFAMGDLDSYALTKTP